MCIYTGICFTATIYVNTPDQDGIRLVPPGCNLLKCSADTLAIFDKVRVEDKYSLYTSVHASTVYAGYVCVCLTLEPPLWTVVS